MPDTLPDPLLTLSAAALARRIRAGESSSEQIVGAHIDWARRINPGLNAIVVDRYDAAMSEAQAADARLRADGPGAVGPLHGVPCTIKECFAFAGLPQTAGLVARRTAVASMDAVTVQRIRRAGAIPIGITNVSELCMWMESNNHVYGRTNNPYDPTRTVGGSSGGEGAIIGAGASPFGLGSDVGGSIRMPAFFNGIFGHKASSGWVPNSGQYPIAHGDAQRYLATGPLVRRAEDLWPLLQILAGPDDEDPVCEARELPPPEIELRGLRVVTVPDNGAVGVCAGLRAAQGRVVAHLVAAGAAVEVGHFPALARSFDIWSSMLSAAGGPTFTSLMANGGFYNPAVSLLAWCMRASDHTLPAIALSLLERLGKLAPRRTRAMVAAGARLRRELQEALGNDGILLYPSFSQAAPRHHRPIFMPFPWVYTAILNVMEMPATQVPLGLDDEGLPLGVQVAASHGNDHLTVALARALEEAFGGWQPPALPA